MNRMTCIAIDDEPLALDLIVSHISKTPFLNLLAQFDNPIDAMEFLQETSVDLIYLDIKMPDLTGVEFARLLGDNSKVIFTTAYEKYAIEGFQLHALDYLLKPISYEVFLKSARYAKEYFELIQADSSNREIGRGEEYLFVRADYQIHRINYGDILYFEGLKDYVKLHTIHSTAPIVFHATMKSIEAKLPADRFMRVHRSFIVSLPKIKTIERDRILFTNRRIPISKQYKPKFDEFIKNRYL